MDSSPSAFMKSFFAEVPNLDELAPDALATKYLNYCYDRFDELTSLVQTDRSSNIFLMDDNTSLSFVTSRSMLVSDTTVLSHQFGTRKHVFRKNYQGYIRTGSPWPGTGITPVEHTTFLFLTNLEDLGKWLREARQLLTTGNLLYSPHFEYDGSLAYVGGRSLNHLRDALIANRRVLDKLSKESLKTGLIKPILSLELPILEKVDLDTFAKITVNENESLANFRNFLHRKLLDIDNSRGSNSYEKDLHKLSLEIEGSVRRLDSETQKMRLKSWFQATGAAVATCTALLIALDQPTLASLASVGGGGGSLWLVTKAMEEILSRQRELRDSPMFYMWLLSESVRRR